MERVLYEIDANSTDDGNNGIYTVGDIERWLNSLEAHRDVEKHEELITSFATPKPDAPPTKP